MKDECSLQCIFIACYLNLVAKISFLQVNLSVFNSWELKSLVHSRPPVQLWNDNVIWEPFPSYTVIPASSREKVSFCTISLKKGHQSSHNSARFLCELIGPNPPVNRQWLQRMSFPMQFNCRWKLPAPAWWRKGDDCIGFQRGSDDCKGSGTAWL